MCQSFPNGEVLLGIYIRYLILYVTTCEFQHFDFYDQKREYDVILYHNNQMMHCISGADHIFNIAEFLLTYNLVLCIKYHRFLFSDHKSDRRLKLSC